MDKASVLSGAMTFIIAGGAIGFLYKAPAKLAQYLQRLFLVSLDVLDTDPVFDWMTRWMSDSLEYSQRSRIVTVSTTGQGTAGTANAPKSDDDDGLLPEPMFSPGPGYHLFWYKGRPVWFCRWRQESASALGRKLECYNFRILGRSQALVREMVEEARQCAERARKSRLSAYMTCYGSWRKRGDYHPRSLDSVILDEGVKERVVADVRDFLKARDWYFDLGIPYHRGYLFSGPPGTGKSSLVSALAGELMLNLYVLNIAGTGMCDERLADLAVEVQPNSLLLLEDIDAVINSRENKDYVQGTNPTGGVTLSGLLNVLDGALSRDGTIAVLTTNFRERLDPALVRPGRVDVEVMLGYSTEYQIRQMFHRFFPQTSESECGRFVAEVRAEFGETVTTAQLQQRLMARAPKVLKAAVGYAPTFAQL